MTTADMGTADYVGLFVILVCRVTGKSFQGCSHSASQKMGERARIRSFQVISPHWSRPSGQIGNIGRTAAEGFWRVVNGGGGGSTLGSISLLSLSSPVAAE